MRTELNKDAANNLKMSFEAFCRECVPVLLKERELLAEVAKNEAQIASWRARPKSAAEVGEAFKAAVADDQEARERALADVLRSYQAGSIPSLAGLTSVIIRGMNSSIGALHNHGHDLNELFPAAMVKKVLVGLPAGVTEAEREAAIASIEKKIADLRGQILAECWPDSRFFFDGQGQKIRNRDRWSEFVTLWSHTARSYNAPVDHEGVALQKNSPGWIAFEKLGLKATGAMSPYAEKHGGHRVGQVPAGPDFREAPPRAWRI